ncbi:MAG TPA: dihydroorotate dehydrogenase-like protein [Vicinamibacterales bacterium]|nr:dihydroorotate dehydrogenase-like protein [Vicinamibacterales bacterium]
MKLTTTYLGLTLAHPFMPGASPLADNLDTVLELEDAGASAIVMRSLFEEQILHQRYGSVFLTQTEGATRAAVASHFPAIDEFVLAPDRYLEQVRRIKARVGVPVIASLNGTTTEGWLDGARWLEKAGADAVEVNFYHVATDWREDGLAVERRLLDVIAVLKETVRIPIAVKLSPFYSSLPHLASQLELIGAAGLVLFNRFYQPDIDPIELDAAPRLQLSTSSDLLLRLRWLAILSQTFRGSLAVTGGVHEPIDAVKAVMAGADAVQIVSALLQKGPRHLTTIRLGFEQWCESHEYESIDQVRDSMSLSLGPDPHAFERGHYARILQSWT